MGSLFPEVSLNGVVGDQAVGARAMAWLCKPSDRQLTALLTQRCMHSQPGCTYNVTLACDRAQRQSQSQQLLRAILLLQARSITSSQTTCAQNDRRQQLELRKQLSRLGVLALRIASLIADPGHSVCVKSDSSGCDYSFRWISRLSCDQAHKRE